MMDGAGHGGIGLYDVHISSFRAVARAEVAEGVGGPDYCDIAGAFRDVGERVPRVPATPFVHPTGHGVLSGDGDKWGSIRIWQGGISIGCGQVRRAKVARGCITKWSTRSAAGISRYMQECTAVYTLFGTLTVGSNPNGDMHAFKNAVDRMLVWVMRQIGHQDGASVLWWLEFQSRGAPHLHLLYTHWIPWRSSAKAWARICLRAGLCSQEEYSRPKNRDFASTSTYFRRLRGNHRKIIKYVRKYAGKSEQKQAPDGVEWVGRWWGVRGLRSRGSCQISINLSRVGWRAYGAVLEELEKAVMRGELRRFAWSEGCGAVYALPDEAGIVDPRWEIRWQRYLQINNQLAKRLQYLVDLAGPYERL